jgi:DNA-binding transcriptional LysR family regulator
VIEQKILVDQLDMGIVEGPVTSPHIVEKMYCDDHLVFIASPHHSLANKDIITVQELANQSFIVREAGSGTQTIFEHAMQASDVPWKVVGIYNNIEAIKQSVIANLGLAVVSEVAIADEVGQGRIVALPVRGISLKRRFNMIYHRQKFFTRAMQSFWDSSLGDLKSGQEVIE